MNLAIAQRLASLNREFYEQHGDEFAEARPRLAPGAAKILNRVRPGARVLEVGCGDGKVGRWLRAHARIAAYAGLDASEAMLARARRHSEPSASGRQPPAVNSEPFTDRCSLEFFQADLADADWPPALAGRTFDWIFAFAVFHHLPGRALRAETLRRLAAHLKPGGALAMSNWQFTRSARLMRLIAGWEAAGLTQADVEPGDYLLRWERKGRRGWRYVHLLDQIEARSLAVNAGLEVIEVFSADGAQGNLAEYVVLQAGASVSDLVLPRDSAESGGESRA